MLDQHTENLIKRTKGVIQKFRSDETALQELQTAIVGLASAFEGSSCERGIGEVLNRLEADLEHIRFISQPEEQKKGALERIARAETEIELIRVNP